jgi:hypothetical protein
MTRKPAVFEVYFYHSHYMEVRSEIKPPVNFILGKGPPLYTVETNWTLMRVRTLSWVLQSVAYLRYWFLMKFAWKVIQKMFKFSCSLLLRRSVVEHNGYRNPCMTCMLFMAIPGMTQYITVDHTNTNIYNMRWRTNEWKWLCRVD